MSNPNGDNEVQGAPDQTVSSLSFSPSGNFLTATSWDKTVKVWEVDPLSGRSQPKSQQPTCHTGPVFCSAWHDDCSTIFTGGADNKVFAWDLKSNVTTQIGEHSNPVKEVAFFTTGGAPIVMTGSWDRTIKFWDLRQRGTAHTVQASERIWCWDVKFPLCVVGTADHKAHIYNLEQLQNPSPYKTVDSPLKLQTRCVSCFTDKSGFAIGSIEGRVGIQYVNETPTQKNFAFKCHRDAQTKKIYAVNSIAFHPIYGTFATAGADGAFHFWDKDSKQRLKQFKNCNDPITATKFNAAGNVYAYATGYDWHRGAEGFEQHKQNHIYIHPVQETEIKNKKSTTKKKY